VRLLEIAPDSLIETHTRMPSGGQQYAFSGFSASWHDRMASSSVMLGSIVSSSGQHVPSSVYLAYSVGLGNVTVVLVTALVEEELIAISTSSRRVASPCMKSCRLNAVTNQRSSQ
jgi:hypothetical protein